MSKTFVLGDPHGSFKAMLQCFERSGFDYENDKLICLGDVVDGWPDTVLCIEELLKIKDMVYIMGNHDVWARGWLQKGKEPIIWTEQGGKASIRSWRSNPELMVSQRDFFENRPCYYIDDQNRIFVHGGFIPGVPLPEEKVYAGYDFLTIYQGKNTLERLLWDRDLFQSTEAVPDFAEVYIGHTTTSHWEVVIDSLYNKAYTVDKFRSKLKREATQMYRDSYIEPVIMENIYRMDTGAGWEGKLSIMDIDTHEFWQSDLVMDLYPEERGRR